MNRGHERASAASEPRERSALSLVEGHERPPSPRLRRGLAVALRAEAEACKGVRGTKSPGES